VLAGDLEAAESLAEAALQIGTEADRPEARPVYLSQRAAIRWAQGRLAEEVETLRELCDSLPALPALRAAHALAAFLGGDVRTAADLLAGAWRGGSIAALPHDQLSLASLLLWAELAAALEERDVSAALFGILDPFRDRVCFNGAAVFGPVAHALGLLAEAAGDRSTALDRLDQSVRLSRRMRARFFEERSAAVVERLRSASRSLPPGAARPGS
jgi:tetratricopeptide (TPR) repeat protein